MGLFQRVEGEAAILSIGGVYKQCDLYTWDGAIYAKAAGGFVRLFEDGSTSKTTMRLQHMTWNGPLWRDKQGRLTSADTPGASLMQPDRADRLLGAPDGSQ